MSKDAPGDDRRKAVASIVRKRMKDSRISVPEVMKRSRLSENIVRDMANGGKSHNGSSWVAISWALGFLPDHLVKILEGETDPNAPAESPMERHLAQMASELTAIGALRNDVGVLKDIVHRIDEKIEIIIRNQDSSDGAAESD